MGKVPYLSRIRVYPIKALDPLEVDSCEITPKGSLKNDREIAIFDSKGRVVSGKREKKIHRIRSRYDLKAREVFVEWEGEEYSLSLEDLKGLSDLFSEILGYRVEVRQFPEGGFPDDRKAHGPTVVSGATIREIAGWFGLSEEETRRRFRANLEIEGVPAFWEDGLVGKEGPGRFRIGEAEFLGEGISKRCPVPTRNPYTGEETKGFVKAFTAKREETLPPWSPRKRFEDTFYRLCVNTNVLRGRSVKVGDEVEVLPTRRQRSGNGRF